MTEAERLALEQRAAARQAVLAKFPDGSAEITDEDLKYLNGAEIGQLINAGRFGPAIGRDKRLTRRA